MAVRPAKLVIRQDGRPLLIRQERHDNWAQKVDARERIGLARMGAKLETIQWRTARRRAGEPDRFLEPVKIEVLVSYRRKPMSDTGNCFPHAKAIVDGIVDAQAIVDDDPAHVAELTFQAPVLGTKDRIVVVVTAARG
jgi:hypothetical protein